MNLDTQMAFLRSLDAWRLFRILSEFVQGFEKMVSLGPSVAFFGSARTKRDDRYYAIAKELGEKIAQKKFAVITGGSGGLMEAVNAGAREAKGVSCGLCIDLPEEEPPNSFIDPKYLFHFRYFFVRKVMFVRFAQAFVVLPGGFGTMDELFEALTLIQTKRIKRFPVYLVGVSYWSGLIDWFKKNPIEHGHLLPSDFDLFHVTDDLDAVADGIEEHYLKVKSLENF